MNNLPYAFYESVFWVGWTSQAWLMSRLCRTAIELSGNIGIIAHHMSSMIKYHDVEFETNRIKHEERWDLNNEVPEHLWIEKDKYVSSVCIYIFQSNDDKVSEEIIDRISFPNAVYGLCLLTDTLSKAWIDWACTAKRLMVLSICAELVDESIALCKRLIETGRLTNLCIDSEAYSEGVMEMMKISLTQPQFKSLRFNENGILKELLAFWSQNKEALRGKDLYLESASRLQFLGKKLKLCPKEKFEQIGRHHFYFLRTLFLQPSHPYKLKYYADDSHPAYVVFDCLEQKPNESEVSHFAKTQSIAILFP